MPRDRRVPRAATSAGEATEGPGRLAPAVGGAHPWQVEVPEEALADLGERLRRIRWPDAIAGVGWSQGTDLPYLQELCDYWRTGFDWREQERRLNQLPHFRAAIGGLDIHFIHQRGSGPRPLPLVLTHGWPSSFLELLKLIPLLADPGAHGADPADAFDVVVPSLPGYGWSERPRSAGVDTARIGELWAALMVSVLGYQRFGAHGGDIGASVSTWLGLDYARHVAGVHLTFIPGSTMAGAGPGDGQPVSETERRFLEESQQWRDEEGGYSHLHRTRPQTLAYALTDSPAGLAAWIVEKYRRWSDCDGRIEQRFTKDELLTNITLYWLTGTIGSSMRLYYEGHHSARRLQPGVRVEVPCGVAVFPREITRPPREWVERFFNVVHWAEMPRGGHFAAQEEPELLARDLRTFFRPLRA